ncbi:hypothetical protein FF38_10758 [Lucilia cuprina]|uniref:DUF659 domain-containing protein n=1 Tax=Lucilia cuprina TaxID=7375 RepID=A0A0L0C134_LUCCU|nr:hypothetical protein FF38_10758 [Lucilia cuprina]
MIIEIHDEFNLNPINVVATVTDNGSHFVKAFKEFGIKSFENKENEEIFNSDDDASDIKDISNEEEITFANLDTNSTCNALWKKGNRPKLSEIIVDIIGSTLKTLNLHDLHG